MFITLFLLGFALCLCFVPEHQVNVIRTWAFVATLLPMWLKAIASRNSIVIRSVLFYVLMLTLYLCLFGVNSLAEPLDEASYLARYCSADTNGIAKHIWITP
jgi:hypothetical protein